VTRWSEGGAKLFWAAPAALVDCLTMCSATLALWQVGAQQAAPLPSLRVDLAVALAGSEH